MVRQRCQNQWPDRIPNTDCYRRCPCHRLHLWFLLQDPHVERSRMGANGTQFIRSRFILVQDFFFKIQYGTPQPFQYFWKIAKNTVLNSTVRIYGQSLNVPVKKILHSTGFTYITAGTNPGQEQIWNGFKNYCASWRFKGSALLRIWHICCPVYLSHKVRYLSLIMRSNIRLSILWPVRGVNPKSPLLSTDSVK